MAESVENQIILEEIENLKKIISPVLSFIGDLRDLKVRNKIPPDSHVNMTNLLSMTIKDDILKEVSALNYPIHSSISDLNRHIGNNHRDMQDKFDILQGTLLEFDAISTQTTESVNHVRGHLNKFYDKIDDIRKELEDKSSLEEVNDIKQKIKQFSYQSDVEAIKKDLIYKAPRDSIEKLSKQIKTLETTIENYVDKSNLEDIKSEIQFKLEAYVDLNFLNQEDFLSFKESYNLTKTKIDEDFKGLIHKFDTQHQVFKKSLSKLHEEFAEKPWKKGMQKVQQEVKLCSRLGDFKDLERAVYPKLVAYKDEVDIFAKKIYTFEAILQRYDEILLEKASKDDVKLINNQILTLTKSSDFKETTIDIRRKISGMECEIQDLTQLLKVLDSTAASLATRIENLKKENKEAASVASNLNSIRAGLQEKVDKIDFHQLIDNTGSKEEMSIVIEKIEKFQKQFELITILSHTLCRTLLNSGESSALIAQQRQDVYRKMAGLLNWVNGEETRVKSTIPWKASPMVRPELFLYRDESLKSIATSARNTTTRVKMRPTRYTPRPVFSSFDLPVGSIL